MIKRTTGFPENVNTLLERLEPLAPATCLALASAAVWTLLGHGHFASIGPALAASTLIPGFRLPEQDEHVATQTQSPESSHLELERAQADAATAEGASTAPAGEDSSWRAIIDALPYAALTLDVDGIVTHQNRLVASLFPQMRQGSAMGQLLRNPDLTSAVSTTIDTGKPMIVHVVERVPVARTIEATITRLELESNPARLLVTFRDLTERDRVEQMRADFVANASHELRTPLASLKGYIETLQGPARNDEKARERFLPIMWSQALRMSRLVDDLLSLSRVEMRAHLTPQGRAELNEVAAYVVQALEPLATSQGAKLVLHPLDGNTFVRADREEIVQALQNLVHNALKYGRTDGQVEIEVIRSRPSGEARECLTLSVKDDGAGIEAHHLPRLVERFYRVNAASSREKGGTGLGLAIVKHIMLRHRGELRISSEVGKGSNFSLLFRELA